MKEIRTAVIQSNDNLVVAGVPIVFDTPTTINDSLGSYTEIIKRSALDHTDLSDVKLLYNHDLNKIPLARSPETMSFNIDEKGLNIRASLPDTVEGNSVYTAIKRKDLNSMSFGFKVAEGGEVFDTATNTRTITNIDKVFECSVVPFPAYPTASISVRSQARATSINDLKIKLNKLAFRGEDY